VLNNTESALRQYDLKSRAIALGWSAEQFIVIDIDQGQSGASAADREGFQQLVAEVGMGRAGMCSASGRLRRDTSSLRPTKPTNRSHADTPEQHRSTRPFKICSDDASVNPAKATTAYQR
jgi:hypothetical protein